jgi:fatty acid-binding protein DegV
MSNYAIISDDAAQGINKELGGKVNFFNINYYYPLENKLNKDQYSHYLPLNRQSTIELSSEVELNELLFTVNAQFDEVFCLISAGGVSSLYSFIENICNKYKGRANFHLIDAKTLSVGQGYLINQISQQVQNDVPAQKIDENIREVIPNIYTLLCTPDLSYLSSNGFMDNGQLIAGEQHSIYSLFSLENGRFNPLEKFKNLHGIEEFLIEFLEEYENLQELAFILPKNKSLPFFQELKHFSIENLNVKSHSEVTSNKYLSSLIGPNGFGLILIE